MYTHVYMLVPFFNFILQYNAHIITHILLSLMWLTFAWTWAVSSMPVKMNKNVNNMSNILISLVVHANEIRLYNIEIEH